MEFPSSFVYLFKPDQSSTIIANSLSLRSCITQYTEYREQVCILRTASSTCLPSNTRGEAGEMLWGKVGRSGRTSALINGLAPSPQIRVGVGQSTRMVTQQTPRSDSDELSSRPFISPASLCRLSSAPARSFRWEGYTALDYSLALFHLASHLSNS
jgi:hypothetical protein